MLAQAISKTIPAIVNRKPRTRRYWFSMLPTPVPAGANTICSEVNVERSLSVSFGWLASHCCNSSVTSACTRAGCAPGRQAPDHIQPLKSRVQDRIVFKSREERIPFVNRRLARQRHPEIRRIAAQCLTEESGRRDSGHGEGRLVNHDDRTNHRGIEREVLLPGAIADYGNRAALG